MSNSIQAIDRGTVHRICSGQVVLTLATAVKELVENSVDAGATSIDIRLKEYGSDLLEVVDNGCGVEESNYQGLTLKHHTSKLQDFSDLVNVETFGFRGEALSSLCALGSLTITTCHQDSLVGAKLEYNHNGKLVQQTPCARQKGTTVSLSQLFYTLPVRHKEFQRNIKKEFTKMVHVLNAYCIISVGLRITCTNQIGKGKKTVILSTNANDNMKDNITNLFGAKQVSSLLTFKQLKPKEEVCEEFGVKTKSDTFNIEGFVSKCEHGQGRSSSDRQFLFINKRPCDVAKISRIVNDVYHMYNRHQNPFVILAISLNKECVDVNVTPDKRQIFVQEEKLLLATIKSSLIQLFEPTTSVYQVNQTTLSFMTKSSKLGCEEAKLTASTSAEGCKTNKSKTISGALASMKRSFASAFARESEGQSAKPKVESQPKQRKLDGFFSMTSEQIVPSSPVLPPCRTDVDLEEDQCGRESQSTTTSCVGSSQEKEAVEIDIAKQEVKFSVIMETARDSIQKFDVEDEIVNKSCIIVNECVDREIETEICGETSEIMVKNALGDHNANDLNNCANRSMDDPTLSIARKLHNSSQNGDRYEDTRQRLGGQEIMKDVVIKVDHVVMDTDKQHNDSERTQQRIYNDEDCVNMAECKQSCSTMDSDDAIEDQEVPSGLKNEDIKMAIIQLDEPVDICRKTEDVSFSMDDIRKKYAACRKNTESKTELYRSFRAKIAPSDNKTAEDELQKEISKDMFKKMDILGQFNLGFIIVKLGNDLFIVDQHATDEKYNFEQLQKTTIIQNQKLIQPQNLELTVANESIVLDNLEIFRANGFEFEINEDAPSTQRVKLVSKPISKNWIFGKEDIDELIFMLSDSPGVMCRPSRVRQMFASRACRKSIMIGTALNQSQMSNVVCHMGEIEQPWNCPHGRPTMRHLINLDMIPKEGT